MGWLQQQKGRLADHVGGRDNNFNLIRFLAATAVLFSHSFALSTGSAKSEPLFESLGTTPGRIAVDVFFLTSGFLVTASLVSRRSLRAFITARCLRIYPGLIVAIVLTTALMGGFFSSLSVQAFFSTPQTWAYVLKNSLMVLGVEHTLPGVFEHNPWRWLVNASLWTLPYELAMYGTLALLWAGLSVRGALSRFGAMLTGLALLATGALAVFGAQISSNALHLTAMFFIGGGFYVHRHRVPLNAQVFGVLALALALSTLHRSVFPVVYLLSLAYLVLHVAYLPSPLLRRFNRLGDVSYGLYIYAWPVQQMTAALVPGIEPLALFGISFPVTLLMAQASWHLIEKRALSFKKQFSVSPEPSSIH